MTITEINSQIREIVKLFTPIGYTSFPIYNLHILKAYFKIKKIPYEIILPSAPEDMCKIFFWDSKNYGSEIKFLLNYDTI